LQVFHRDCLIRLGYSIAPRGLAREGQPCVSIEMRHHGETTKLDAKFGELHLIPLGEGLKATVTATPARGFDLGVGPGKALSREVSGGVVGLLIDCRGRPLVIPSDKAQRVAKLRAWNKALDMYPE
jgi:hypothetical protein